MGLLQKCAYYKIAGTSWS